ncbi:permease prefix domain 1-containing protein [Micromonospora sp. PLK6-60]|uniref:permease prefix domain 1-containing protein n=1 Tax=Micromonospora sp. PLK6-60 TaxID=2873383 RepID=UPI001CA65CE4|nr:permease prefix domain 1-containing protein [Micromonospora sp. PLK6-60]MBY8871507.1 permease prefix domain 1-containing protein [Micromonospora sp. PLK6-60]
MRGVDGAQVEAHLRNLDVRLHGPARSKAELLTEARHALWDAVEAYQADGLSGPDAERRAVDEFGSPAELVPAYQAELAAGALRGLAVRGLVVAAVLIVAGDLTWQGSSWSQDGPRPPAGYLLLSASVNWIWAGVALLAVVGLLALAGAARRGRPGLPPAARLAGLGMTGLLAVGAVTGCALYAWSLNLWDAALTWPPMIVGLVAGGAAWFSLGRAARTWLLATR